MAACLTVTASLSYCQTASFSTRPLTRLEAGTPAADNEVSSWNRLLLRANPNFTSGATDALAGNIRQTIASFQLTLMAQVVPHVEPNRPDASYRLLDVGVGYSLEIDGRPVVVTTAAASALGGRLDFAARQILYQQEQQLSKVQLVASTPTLSIFDAPSLMLRDGKHEECTTRHFLWLESTTGRLAMLLWLLAKDQPRMLERKVRWVKAGTLENRRLHVDGQSFFLGIPTRHAFALEGLPPGVDFEIAQELSALAGQARFDASSLSELAGRLNRTLHPALSEKAH
jgi:hypothetical protein